MQTDTGNIPDSRTLAKQRRREQLIKATINCVAKRGFSATTMADITQEAGLSLGIVNLHFKSKDKLLLETLKYMAEEYRRHWEKTLEKPDLRRRTNLPRWWNLISVELSPTAKNWQSGSRSGGNPFTSRLHENLRRVRQLLRGNRG